MIAALFVETNGPYFGLPDVEPWDVNKNAKDYTGPHRVVAHPPCERWGRYWSGGPSAKEKRTLGDDNGCFAAALAKVKYYGGILEHPEASHAWTTFGLLRPNPNGGWTYDARNWGWVCQVEQGHYGHPARKKTWLFAHTLKRPMELIWGPSSGRRLDEGFHSAEERKRAREAGQEPRPRLSKKECVYTPPAFRDVLIQIAGT